MPDSDKVKPTLKGLSVLAAGFALHLVIGSLYLWGSIGVYVASYYRFRPNGTESSKIRLATTGSIFPAQNVCLNIGMILGLGLAQKFGFRKFSLGVSALMVSAIWASALITNFYLFFLLYAGVFGFLSGLLFMLPLYLGWNYFPSRRGISTPNSMLNPCRHGQWYHSRRFRSEFIPIQFDRSEPSEPAF